MNREPLRKAGMLPEDDNMGIRGTYWYLTQEGFLEVYQNFKWYLLSSFAAPGMSICSVLLCERIFVDNGYAMIIFLKESSALISSVVLSYPFHMLHFRSLVGTKNTLITLDALKERYKAHGISVFFTGCLCSVLGANLYKPVLSVTHSLIGGFFGIPDGGLYEQYESSWVIIIAQYLSAISASILIYPFDLVRRTSLINEHAACVHLKESDENTHKELPTSVQPLLQWITEKEGISALWNGCLRSLISATARVSALVTFEWLNSA